MSPSRPTARLLLTHLVVRDVRNIAQLELRPTERLNVISGGNGQGKTSVLEALYLLATSRSFRTARLTELTRHGADCAIVRGRFSEASARDGGERPPPEREQSCALQGNRRTLRMDGEPPTSLAYYATRAPVVAFEPQQLELSTGGASARRMLLDRVTLFIAPATGADRTHYRRALAARQALLLSSPSASQAAELAAFESLLARHGAALHAAREHAAALLADACQAAFAAIAPARLKLSVRYAPGGSADPELARSELAARRTLDARRHRTSFGPHLDDLTLCLDGHRARSVASQGQHRLVTLTLKIAELRCIAEACQLEPILLLDDVSSELDTERAAALFDYLTTTRCQMFLTTTRPELIVSTALRAEQRADFVIAAGRLVAPDPPREQP